MQSKEKIIELGKKLPRGSKKIISQKSGLSYRTILMYFDGNEVTFETEAKIIPIVQEYIDLIKENQKAKQNLFNYGL